MGVLHEVDADSYGTTPLATALAVPKYPDGFPFWFVHNLRCLSYGGRVLIGGTFISIDTAWPPFTKLHEYLAKTGYKNPANPMDGPFQYGHNTPLHFFGWMTEHPKVLDTFNNHMTVYRQGRPSWMDPDFYPVEDLLAKGMNTDKDAVLLVDIGGGLGHDIEEFQRKLPQLPGRLILQDQAQVIKETSNVHKSIEPMVTDFFTPQPIKGTLKVQPYMRCAGANFSLSGARAYYMHSVLHDWPDDRCRDILLNIIPSMTKGYSKILINENVIPDKDAHWMSTALDWFMMVFFSSCERTEKSWRELLTSVGLKVVKIWTYEPGTESLIEAELV